MKTTLLFHSIALCLSCVFSSLLSAQYRHEFYMYSGSPAVYGSGAGNICLGPVGTSAQISTSASYFSFGSDIRVGTGSIGSATNNLFLKTGANMRMTILSSNGNVGIGTISPSQKLEVIGNTLIKGLNGFDANGEEAILYLGDNNNFIKSIHGQGLVIGTYCWNSGVDMNTIYVNHCGQVGIGTSLPGSFKLAVDGYIGARGVKVTSTNPFPDYVFEPNYNLMSIGELSCYINENKHLPNIPSANQVIESGGIDIGDLQVKLLEKIEEQTLYIISLQEQINALQSKVELLIKK